MSRSLEWTGQDTKLARLLSLVDKFDAECEFATHLNRDGTLDKIVLNIYRKHDDNNQGVGTRRKDVTLYYGKEIKEIRRTIDKTGLYTAIKPIGTDGLNISTLDKTELDEDGNVLFRSPKGDTHILCPALRDEYPSQVVDPTGDRYINLDWTYETKNVNTLYGQALAKLKSVYMPAITYEVDGFIQLEIGDTIKIHDNGFAPLLLLEARVSEQEISFSKPDRNKTTFANFRALENRLSSDIQSRLKTLVQEAVPYKADIVTTDGLIFKNGEGSTTLTARISKGNAILTNQLSVLWYKDGVAFSTSESVTVRAEDIESKAVYRFEGLDAEGVTKCFAEVTIADVSDGTPGETGAPGKPGADGKTPYLHIAYANSADGKTGFSATDSTDKLYIGQYTDYTQADSTDPTKYAWTRIKGDKGATGDQGLRGLQGEKGDPTGITVSDTEPTSKYTGMLWQNTGTSGGRIKDATYRWTGSTWELFYFAAENIQATTLSAITTNLGTVNAGTINGVDINGSVFKNIFALNDGTNVSGTTTISDGKVNIDSNYKNGLVNVYLSSVLKYDGLNIEWSGQGLGAHYSRITRDGVSTGDALNNASISGSNISLSSGAGSAIISPDTFNNKAPNNHASSNSTYGLGSTANYGHVKTRDNLTASAYTNGEALSARQGYILNNKINLSDKMQKGSVSGITVSGSSNATRTVTFPAAFSSTPTVVATPIQDSATGEIAIYNISTTGFTARITNRGSLSYSYGLNWIAMT